MSSKYKQLNDNHLSILCYDKDFFSISITATNYFKASASPYAELIPQKHYKTAHNNEILLQLISCVMRLSFVIVFLLLACSVHAQNNARITGKVYDSVSRGGLEYATVTVMDRVSHNVINGAVSDPKGSFSVTGLPAGNYLVSVDFLGYTRKTFDNISVTANKDVSLGTIYLAPKGQALQGVVISGAAPIIENKIDKMVYNAANDITSQSGAAIDVLKKVPQVNVDIDGNVELQGSTNIRFLINGKPSSVFGNSLTDALATIPANQIKSIEVITSPGAKYDAQGTGGIINIILKSNNVQGFNGSVNLSGGTLLENGSVNLNVRHNKFGVNAYLSGNAQRPSHTPVSQDRYSYDSAHNVVSHLMQNSNTDFTRDGYQAGIGFDWSPKKQDNINGNVSYNHYGNNSDATTFLQQSTAPDTNILHSTRYSNSSGHNESIDWSLNYKKSFEKEGQELDVLYSSSFGTPHSNYSQSQIYDNAPLPYMGAKSSNPGTDRQSNISIDYAQPLSEKVSFETGAKAVLQTINSGADINTYRSLINEYVYDPGQSYHLNYNRQIYAGYLSASFQVLHDYLKIKTGVRYEHTDTKIDFANTAIPAYNSVVPSITLSHDIDKTSFIKLAYSRRLERPDYRDLNPFLNRADPYNISTGNPLLMPEIGNNFEIGFNKNFGKGSNLYIALIERINTQDHKQFTRFYTSYAAGDSVYTNVTVSMPENTGTEYNSGINISGSYTLHEKLSLRGNVSVFHRYLATSIGNGDINAGFRVRTNLNASYAFSKNLIAEAFGNYNSATNNIQGRSPQNISYTIAFRKQFWDKKGSFGVTATNLFNEYTKQVTTIATTSYSSYSLREVPYRSVGLSFSYKFGKLEFKKGREDNGFMNDQPTGG